MDRFMTAQEIADAAQRLGLSCVPHTKRAVNMRAKREFWEEFEQFARKRSGAVGGGGIEYHVSLLPDAMQSALLGEVSKLVAVTSAAQTRAVEVAKREVLDTTDLTARQRQVMNARSQVLSTIENVQIAEGNTRSRTVDLFVESATNFDLDVSILVAANDRRNEGTPISRRTILRWFQSREKSGIAALAPKATKERRNPCMVLGISQALRPSAKAHHD
jgi:putative transposase